MWRRLLAPIAALALGLTPAGARAAGPTETPTVTASPPVVAPTASTPDNLLAAADAAVDGGDLELARSLYERVAAEHPGAPEAGEARRALKILAARARTAPPRAAAPAAPTAAGGTETAAAPTGDGVIVRREPYSLKTSERLRLTTWEKLDFGVTSFLYGMSVGFSYALSLDSSSSANVFPPIAIGALSYTLGSVAFLHLANPDRGDLPLALAIVSYVPTTTLLVANVAFDNPDDKTTALASAGAGLVSIPLAVVAARELDLDPGDTQLVRDAGFWGLALATTGMLGFGGTTGGDFGFTYYQEPSGRAIAGAGLAGLYGGLAIGTIAAFNSEISLERVRVTTWGGYGGAIVGLLIGASATSGGNESGLYRGVAIGALGGLVVTFLASSGLDGIPPEETPPATSTALTWTWTPTVATVAGADGRLHPGLGFSGLMF